MHFYANPEVITSLQAQIVDLSILLLIHHY